MLIPERLEHRDHAGAKALLLAGRHDPQLADGLPGHGDESAELTQRLAMVRGVGAKEFRDGEDLVVLEAGGAENDVEAEAGRQVEEGEDGRPLDEVVEVGNAQRQPG